MTMPDQRLCEPRVAFIEDPKPIRGTSIGDIYMHAIVLGSIGEPNRVEIDGAMIDPIGLAIVAIHRYKHLGLTQVSALFANHYTLNTERVVRQRSLLNRYVNYQLRVDVAHDIAKNHIFNQMDTLKAVDAEAIANDYAINFFIIPASLKADSLQTS